MTRNNCLLAFFLLQIWIALMFVRRDLGQIEHAIKVQRIEVYHAQVNP